MAGQMIRPADALRLARFGPFFALAVISDAIDPAGVWLPVSALGSDQELLDTRIGAVRSGLAATPEAAVGPEAAVEERVALSITQLGLIARLSAVALAAAVDGYAVPQAEQLVFSDELGGPFPLALIEATSRSADEPWPAGVLALIRPVTEAAVRRGLSPRIAWGNVASALAGAAAMIALAEPAAADRATVLLAAALSSAELTGAGDLSADGFRRRSCCLIYRLPSRAGFCGDCVLGEGSVKGSVRGSVRGSGTPRRRRSATDSR